MTFRLIVRQSVAFVVGALLYGLLVLGCAAALDAAFVLVARTGAAAAAAQDDTVTAVSALVGGGMARR